MNKLLTTDEVAEIIRLSPETLAQWRWLSCHMGLSGFVLRDA